MVEIARAACEAGKRVWWVGLPAQRPGIFRRVTAGGFTALGLEVMNSQQMYYRLLAGPSFVDLKPLVVGTARLVRVGAALAECAGSLPAPGEAKLFAAAIAEAKRFGLEPAAVAATAADDVEVERLATVFAAYQRAMAGHWDYDDVRAQAAVLVAGARFKEFVADEVEWARGGLPDLVIVDGLRELGPIDLRVLIALGAVLETHLTLPEAPEGVALSEVDVKRVEPDSAEHAITVHRYRAANAVAEARFIMRSLKRDLALGGFDLLDLAVVATPGTAAALVALADEYGVPLMDESPQALADTPAGATLLDLLELPETPTASRLLAIPELAPLAAEALRLKVGGADALTWVARRLHLEGPWREWQRRLRVGDDPVAWTKELLDDVLRLTHPELDPTFASRVLSMAQEAAKLAAGEGFAVWLAALLRDTRVSTHAPGGVALLDATLVSGRRFRRVYVLGAVEGAFRAAEREDYFVSEELRGPVAAAADVDAHLPQVARLPRRFKGRDEVVVAELLTRADETVITAPEAGADGPQIPDRRLLGDEELPPLPLVAAGSALELSGPPPYLPTFDPVELGVVEPGAVETGAFEPGAVAAEYLRRYDQCAFRAWGERVLLPSEADDDAPLLALEPGPEAERPDEWHRLVPALTAFSTLTTERLDDLGERFPDFRDWLQEHAEHLSRLTWGAELTHLESGVTGHVHAGERVPVGSRGREKSVIYRFVEPTADPDWNWARDKQRDRWTEYLAAAVLLNHRSRAPSFVEIYLWPLLGEPLKVDTTTSNFVAERLGRVSARAAEAMARFRTGDVTPSPGFHCRDCPVFDVCRVGQRT